MAEDFLIRGDMILLGPLLKVAGYIDSGSDAKWFLGEYEVKVNGELDDRRGRKLYEGDLVEFPDGKVVRIVGS